jgi:hypothetical protein
MPQKPISQIAQFKSIGVFFNSMVDNSGKTCSIERWSAEK